jgi:hypothetical protein
VSGHDDINAAIRRGAGRRDPSPVASDAGGDRPSEPRHVADIDAAARGAEPRAGGNDLMNQLLLAGARYRGRPD